MITAREYESAQRVVEVEGRPVAYVDEGEGPPLVLLHGTPTWGYLWHALVPGLARGRRVIVPDLPGHGWSDRRTDRARSLARAAVTLLELLEAIGVPRADLAGHDRGGDVALRMAAIAPARVGRVAVLSAPLYAEAPSGALLDVAFARPPLAPARAQSILRRALAVGFERTPAPGVIEGLLAPYATEAGALSLRRCASALDPGETAELATLLPRLAAPTLVLWGEHDAVHPLALGARLAWELPAARLVTIPDANHFAPLEVPDAVLRRLLAFLEGGRPRVAQQPRRAPTGEPRARR
jgi:pimeloyl-ACP methyl ester carboxylesterase